MAELDNNAREDVFSKAVRAGKRTYFFDVKTTKAQDYYLTITESKKRLGDEGSHFYEKHKLFLYKEDFEKFIDGLSEAVEYIRNAKPEEANRMDREASEGISRNRNFTDISFDDLGKNGSTQESADL